ncbi:restriction endonuclease subunit S, partial [Citrobacter sedlakii]
MSKFITVKLNELAAPGRSVISGPFGSNIGQRFFKTHGVPIIRGNNLTTDFKKFNDDGFVFLTEEKADELKSDAIKGDILFTAAGTIGQVGMIPQSAKYDRYVISNKQLRFRVDPKKAEPDYVYYWLASPWIYKTIIDRNTGSTVPLINLGIIKSLPVSLPKDIIEQKKIASVLANIDEKIVLNNRINTELEAMAKTLYDYWFVQFDFPDANGKPYKTSGGKMEYNATLKREIPVGWNDSILGEFIELERGVTYSKEDVKIQDNKDTIGVLRATNVTGNAVDIDDLVLIPSCKASTSQMLRKFDVLIVMSSGSKQHVGKNGVYYFEKPNAFGAFCSKITPNNKFRYFINTFLQSEWFKSYIN